MNRLELLLEKQKRGNDVLSTGELIELEILRSKRIKFGIKFDGYCVIYPNYTGLIFNEIQDWVRENCTGLVCSDNYDNDRLFVFKKVEDAMAFKLRWL